MFWEPATTIFIFLHNIDPDILIVNSGNKILNVIKDNLHNKKSIQKKCLRRATRIKNNKVSVRPKMGL